MGLDINVYKNLKEVENPKLDDDGYVVNYDTEWNPGGSMEWSEKHFPGRGKGICHDKVYTYDDKYRFWAGSYLWYYWWRENLRKFKGDIAFQELINFADNEGVIGPIVSKKLYEDFKKYEKDAKEYSKCLEDNGRWIDKYSEWMEAFKIASENGAVEFC